MDSFTCENAIKLERDYENNQNDFIIVKITSEELFCINTSIVFSRDKTVEQHLVLLQAAATPCHVVLYAFTYLST